MTSKQDAAMPRTRRDHGGGEHWCFPMPQQFHTHDPHLHREGHLPHTHPATPAADDALRLLWGGWTEEAITDRVREALITSGLMHRLREYARRAYTDMQDETEADLAQAWARHIVAALATQQRSEPAGLDVEALAAVLPDSALAPYTNWTREGLARLLAEKYARCEPQPDGAASI